MALAQIPPPPVSNNPADPAFRDWFYKIYQAFVIAGSINWNSINLPDVDANEFLGGPTDGSAAQAAFRTLVLQDIPPDVLAFAAAHG